MLRTLARFILPAILVAGLIVACGPPPQGVQIPVGNSPSQGPANAKVTFFEFADFQCPYCGQAYPTMENLFTEYQGKVLFVFKQFPLPQHPYAQGAAEASLAANAQGKFWPMYSLLFQNQNALTPADLDSYAQQLGLNMAQFDGVLDAGTYAPQISTELHEGEAAGVQGTPTFFVNGQAIAGAQPQSVFEQAINADLAQ